MSQNNSQNFHIQAASIEEARKQVHEALCKSFEAALDLSNASPEIRQANQENIICTHMLQYHLADPTVYVKDNIAYTKDKVRFAKVTRIQDELVVEYDEALEQLIMETKINGIN